MKLIIHLKKNMENKFEINRSLTSNKNDNEKKKKFDY